MTQVSDSKYLQVKTWFGETRMADSLTQVHLQAKMNRSQSIGIIIWKQSQYSSTISTGVLKFSFFRLPANENLMWAKNRH